MTAFPPEPTPRRSRPYVFYDVVRSICSTCLSRCDGKLLIEEGQVWMEKWCRAHGHERVLVAEDADWWRWARERFLKPAEMPMRFQTPMRWGCPYDCGLCPDHQQHACLVLIEVGDHCNLACPVCFAESGPHRPGWRPLEEIERMLDGVVRAEGRPDVVQISGGEPTIHPDFWRILDAAKSRPIRHLMVNTNGVAIARDPEFAKRLAAYQPGFEVYLQFDSLRDDALQKLRGASLASSARRRSSTSKPQTSPRRSSSPSCRASTTTRSARSWSMRRSSGACAASRSSRCSRPVGATASIRARTASR